jgi:hypothetical protein
MGSAVADYDPILLSGAMVRACGDGAEVRCAACRKLLFKVQRAPDSGLMIERSCRGLHEGVTCGLVNQGRVTDRPGKPVTDTLPEVWACSRCGGRLARVFAVRGRIAVRCRCGVKITVTAAEAMNAIQPLDCAS